MKRAFGDHAKDLVMTSTKSYTGHLLGASGALESAICLKALEDQYVPTTIHLENQDPECDLTVSLDDHNRQLQYVMNNSLGFGGHNASLIFKKWEV